MFHTYPVAFHLGRSLIKGCLEHFAMKPANWPFWQRQFAVLQGIFRSQSTTKIWHANRLKERLCCRGNCWDASNILLKSLLSTIMFYVFEANFDPNPSFYTKYFLVDFRETLVLLLFLPKKRTKAQPEDLTSSASLGREEGMQPLRDTDPKSRLDGGARGGF